MLVLAKKVVKTAVGAECSYDRSKTKETQGDISLFN